MITRFVSHRFVAVMYSSVMPVSSNILLVDVSAWFTAVPRIAQDLGLGRLDIRAWRSGPSRRQVRGSAGGTFQQRAA